MAKATSGLVSVYDMSRFDVIYLNHVCNLLKSFRIFLEIIYFKQNIFIKVSKINKINFTRNLDTNFGCVSDILFSSFTF